jgi:EAL domain-containing protein (putative c-di-GMP-specific phosphodiesterase class I)
LKGQPGGRGWDGRLVSAIIAIGHSLRVDVVAEGVETEAQLNFLKEQQCQKAQGYFLGRPMPMADFLAYIERHWPAGQPTQTVA